MNIIFTDISNFGVFILPIVPPDVEIKTSSSNETLKTIDGEINIIGNENLRTMEWRSFFPVHNNSYAEAGSIPGGWVYVAFLEMMKKLKLPIRVICVTKEMVPFANMLMSIDDFNFHLDKPEDINYTIKLTEFPMTFWGFINPEKAYEKYKAAISEKQSSIDTHISIIKDIKKSILKYLKTTAEKCKKNESLKQNGLIENVQNL